MVSTSESTSRGRNPPHGRLSLRLGLALCGGAAVIFGATSVANLRLHRAQLTRLVSLSADRIAETIRTATRDAMMRNDREALHRTIANIGSQHGIARIRIFDKRGTIRTSTQAEEVGRLVDVKAEQCYACHQPDGGLSPLQRLPTAERVRTFRDAGGQRILGIIAPIHNEPQCIGACHAHPATQTVLGVLDVQLSMAAVDEALLASERQMQIGLAATVVAVLALAGLLLWRMVLSPVMRLTEAMSRVAGGDLQTQVPVGSSDEIGRMGISWNAMTAELARARAELTEWNRTLEERVREKTDELAKAHQRMLLVEKMAVLGRLAAVMAHEINNPLAGIRTYARLLRRRQGALVAAAAPTPEGAETDRILHMIDSEAGRCGDIVRNLLLFSRTPSVRIASEDVVPIVERCVLLVRHQAELLGVTLRVEIATGLPPLECDAAQIEQALLALVMNALEATASGGAVTLSVRAAAQGEALEIVVHDTGCGIPPENLGRIFEPFFTTKEQGRGLGLGLGLAVSYGIVTRHRGRIDVDSRVGAGTTFTIRLPLRQATEPAAPAEGGGP